MTISNTLRIPLLGLALIGALSIASTASAQGVSAANELPEFDVDRDADALRERIAAHRDAGADHVCIQPLRADGGPGPDLETLEALAPVNAG